MRAPDFTGKAALVTGAASGIGAAVAARLEESGARVHRTDLNGAGPAERIATLDVREEAASPRHMTGVELPVDDGYLL
jgi:NAD(P)-dependent dehydrogenase (short-subunit alcohol dehydrogenase family)